MTDLPPHIQKLMEMTRDPAFYLTPPRPAFQPPVAFENMYGVSGIAHTYVLPKGMTADDLQNIAMLMRQEDEEHRLSDMGDVLSVLASLNPPLRKLRYPANDTRPLYHVIMGVASAFNTADIQYFISHNKTGKCGWLMEKTKGFARLRDSFNRVSAGNPLIMQWVPAPHTLAKMQKQFAARV